MPLLPFLSGAAGDPINLKRRVALQDTLGVPATANFVDTRNNGGPFTITKEDVERLAIQSGGAPPQALPGKALLQGGPFDHGDLDPADPGQIAHLCNVFKRYDVTDNTTWYRWKWGLDGTSKTEAAWLTYLNDNDVLPRTRITDLLLGGFDLAAEPSGNLQMTWPFVAGLYDFWGDPVQETGSGSTLPILLYTSEQNWYEDATDGDIWIFVEAITTAGVATLRAGVSSDTVEPTWGTSPITFTYDIGDNAVEAIDYSTGERLGKCAQTPRLYWPSTATLSPNDVFRFPKRRASWVESLATDHAIPAINTRLYLNDELIRVEGGWTLSVAWDTLEAQQDVSFEQGATVRRKGRMQATLELTRELADLAIQKVMHEREEVSVVIECCSDDIIDPGSTDTPYQALFVLPSLQPSGDMFGVTPGGTDTQEVVTLRAGVPDSTYTFAGINFDSHMHVVFDTGVDPATLGTS